MKHIRHITGLSLISTMHQCNLADVEDSGVYEANDLNPKCSQQHEAYGHLQAALRSMGFNNAVEVYIETGDVDLAKAEVSKQYPNTFPNPFDHVEHIEVSGGVAV